MAFVSLSCLVALAGACRTTLSRSGGHGYHLSALTESCSVLHIVLVRVSAAVMQHHDEKQVGELTLLYPSSSSKEARTGTQTQLEPRGRS